MKSLEIKKIKDLENKLVDFRNGKVDKYLEGDYEWLPTRECFYCSEKIEVGSDYDIYELTTHYSNYESSSGRYSKLNETELWIICSEYDCQTSIRTKSSVDYGLTAQGGNPTIRVLATKLIDGVANRRLEKSVEKLAEEKIEQERIEKEREFKQNNWEKVSFVKIENEIWAKRIQDCTNGAITTKIVVSEPKRKDKVELVNQFKNEGLIDEIWDKKRWEKI